jgi:hypothetical protein
MFIDQTYLLGLLGVVGADLRSDNSEHTVDLSERLSAAVYYCCAAHSRTRKSSTRSSTRRINERRRVALLSAFFEPYLPFTLSNAHDVDAGTTKALNSARA